MDEAFLAAAVAHAREVLSVPVRKWLEKRDLTYTVDLFQQSAFSVHEADPELALNLWLAIDELVRSLPEARRIEYDHRLLSFAAHALAPDALEADGSSIELQIQTLSKFAHSGSWSRQSLAHALFGLALSTTATDQEGEGLVALAKCSDLAKAGGPDPVMERVLPVLRAVLETGSAANAVTAGRFRDAAAQYVALLGSNLDAGYPLRGLYTVRCLIDLAKPDKVDCRYALRALILALAKNALRLELAAASAATNLIQPACRFAMSELLQEGGEVGHEMMLVLDIAKGRRFRAALTDLGPALEWINHPETLNVRKELLRLKDQVALESDAEPANFDQNELLSAYAGSLEMSGGVSADAELRNLQIRFDADLDRQLSQSASDSWAPSIESIKSRLNSTSVLLILYIGENREKTETMTLVLISDRECFVGQTLFVGRPSFTLMMDKAQQSISSSMIGMFTSSLRDNIARPPGPRVADSVALAELEKDYKTYLDGPLGPYLNHLRASGKNHLCICPHGPLHFYPFHLLGPEEQPLAKDWCVTYLPHPFLLGRKTHRVAEMCELTSVGINFAAGNQFNLSELMESEDEAIAIAQAYGGRANLLIGSKATKKHIMKALANSHRVHISTHGLHNISAPSFQCIFVQPDPADDGMINAYELLQLDLRGLDLITLSACETALGRFDVADNLRGIPAALLIAGASTVVGSLWNVESETATFFFTAFYQKLDEKHGKRDSFFEAQALTRDKFPKYRDWGAFQFMGSWQ
ncbi:MAG: CHAT domain-containing protein [Acidobacteriaceae bacterium]